MAVRFSEGEYLQLHRSCVDMKQGCVRHRAACLLKCNPIVCLHIQRFAQQCRAVVTLAAEAHRPTYVSAVMMLALLLGGCKGWRLLVMHCHHARKLGIGLQMIDGHLLQRRLFGH